MKFELMDGGENCYITFDELTCTQGIAIGLTIYNEDANQLLVTFFALLRSVHFTYQEIDHEKNEVTIAILCDGADKISPSCIKLFQYLNLWKTDRRFNLGNLIGLSQQKWSIGTLIDCLSSWEAHYYESKSEAECIFSDYFVNILFLVKRENRGKLDSHWWFYRKICERINPKYCVQIDAGTCPELKSLSLIINHLEANKTVAAVAPKIQIEPPSKFDLIGIWQFGEFWRAHTFEWPSEVACGYLSVIPGQYSVIRWNAIFNSDYKPDFTSPLDTYFNGLNELSPFDTSLYLAEDRVLCLGIFFNQDASWKIDYFREGTAITDACSSWLELLRQRRRWCNGYLASRIYLIKKFLFHFDPNSRMSSGAVAYQLFILIYDWLTPSLTTYFYYQTYQACISEISGSRYFTQAFQWLSVLGLCLLILQAGVYLKGGPDKQNTILSYMSMCAQTIFILCALTIFSMSNWNHILATLILFAGAGIQVFSGNRENWEMIWIKSVYFAFRPATSLSIWMYSIFNCHDNSWGTKGLTSLDKTQKSKINKFYRFSVVILWMLSNALIFSLLLTLAENPINGLFIIIAIIALREFIPIFISSYKKTT